MVSEPIRVAFTKYDGSLHWHHMATMLGEDEHGVWLGIAPGEIHRKGLDGPPVTHHGPYVMLIPRSAWWTAVFNTPATENTIYCDIASVPVWTSPTEVTMIDLDLDVLKMRTGDRVLLVDEDEFEEHQVRYGYPPEIIATARASAEWLLEAVTSGTEPFGTAYRRWLALMAAEEVAA